MGIITSVKTQIIQLEVHDDTLSVRDKMDWSQTPRVLLIWPERGKVLRSRLDLILLERYCSSQGSQLALLSKDPEVIYQAGKAGIPVFQSRKEAQLQPWGKSYREFQRQDLQRYKTEHPPPENLHREHPPIRKKLPIWARIPIFTLGVVAVLAIAATLLPSAKIIIQPELRGRRLVVPFQAQIGEGQIGISGIVPGRALDIVVSDQLSRLTTGTISIPSQYSRGRVVFTNLGEESISIPENTVLSTGGDDPVLFQTLESAKTAPGAEEQTQVQIEALYPGAVGNVAEGRIREINLAEGAELSVTNPKPTSGGTDILIPAPDEGDRQLLSRELNLLLKEKARKQVELTLDPDDILLSRDWDDFEILTENYTPEENYPGDTLWLERTIEYRVYFAAVQDLEALAKELVLAQYQGGSYLPHLESITLKNLSEPVEDQGQNYSWQIEITWEDSRAIDDQDIIPWIAGKNIGEAGLILQERLGLEKAPEIILQPSWWPNVPILPFRIQIFQGGSENGQ